MLEHYEFSQGKEAYIFEFVSIGNKGQIKKIVRFLKTNGGSNYFHFGFGDWNETLNDVDDTVVSNNGDTSMIFSTIGMIIDYFTDRFPDAWVYAKANTSTRTRFYRIVLSNNLDKIQDNYQLLGLLKGVWKPFEKDKPYTAFLIKRK